jgi:SAM-dependent methyltransferase
MGLAAAGRILYHGHRVTAAGAAHPATPGGTRVEGRRVRVFERNGPAALSDLKSGEWATIFTMLENKQARFLEDWGDAISREYKWPRDPLHTWSRVWEYPYIYYTLARWHDRTYTGEKMLHVVDLGSGVTFFPFTMAELGFHVTCVDVDPVVERDLSRVIREIPPGPGRVDFRSSNGTDLPFEDGEIDAVYSVSVVEHVAHCEPFVSEIARTLRPDGLFALTFDLDLRGDQELGPGEYRRLREAIDMHFEPLYEERTVHVTDILRSDKGPYPALGVRGLTVPWFLIKQRIIKPLLGRRPCAHRLPYLLAVVGLVLKRRP